MERLLGRKFWIGLLLLYMSVVIWAGEPLAQLLFGQINKFGALSLIGGADQDWRNWAVVPITLLFTVLYCKPVWRFLWRVPVIGRFFSDKVFPDLNGVWDVEMHSNWPMIDKMQKTAAEGGALYDVLKLERPEMLAVKKLVAIIDIESPCQD